jgi:hypothetical protein
MVQRLITSTDVIEARLQRLLNVHFRSQGVALGSTMLPRPWR